LDNQPKEMSYEKFDEFIDNLGFMKYFIKSVGLTAKGEPMKHPGFYWFCHKLNSAGIKFSITTNGDYLDKTLLHYLPSFKYLTTIRVSIYDIRTYNRLKGIDGIEFYNMTDTPIKGVVTGRTLWADGLTTNNIPKDFNKIKSCRKPFSYLTLNPDGAVTHCNSWYELGNAFEQPLHTMWNSKKSVSFRKRALKMDNVPCVDCLNCGFNL
jgi:MoaA/NifB/PqqE/SkfB family radical SAM enzyme